MSSVRLRYPAILNYLASLYRVLAAIAFAIIVIRKLGVYQFGIWTVAFSLANFLSLPVTMWGYWESRFVARGFREAVPTGLGLTLAYLTIASALYVAISWLLSAGIGGFSYLALYGTLLMALQALGYWASSAATVIAPEVGGYAALIFHTARICLAYALVAYAGMGLDGAFIAVITSRALSNAYTTLVVFRRGIPLARGFSRSLASSWLRRLYIPLISAVDAQIRSLDRALAAAITGSAEVAAVMGAAYTAQTPIGSAGGSTAIALRARLLRAPRASDVEESLRLTLLLSGFTLATLVTLSKPVLTLLNPVYESAWLPFVVTSVSTFVLSIASIYAVSSVASERSDVDTNASLVSTRLFRTPFATLCCDSIALAAATSIVAALRVVNAVSVATVYALAWLASSLAILVIARRHAMEAVKASFPARQALEVAIASIAVVATYLALGANEIVVASFWRDAPRLAMCVAIAGAIYVATLLAVSSWFRNLLRVAIERIVRG